MTFAEDRGIETILTPFHPYAPHVWSAFRAVFERASYRELVQLALQWARSGDFERLEQLYLTLGRSESLSFPDFCDSAVRSVLSTVGHEWQDGRLRVGDEHMVTEAVRGALLALRREWGDVRFHREVRALRAGRSDDRPTAVVGTLEGNRHSIGSLCVRILLEQEGWRVYFPGADVPTDDFGVIQMSREASLVCITLPPNGTLGDVTRTLSVLRERYDRARPYSLAFGGLAALSLEGTVQDDPFETVAFFPDVTSLRGALHEGLGLAAGAPVGRGVA